MKILSLFDGIGGARQALKELNIGCEYYASEIDRYAIEVAKINHPDILHIGDVKNLFKYNHLTDIRFSQFYKINRGELDLLIGGSPCQDLSISKKNRQGLKGERSSLFYEYVRILNEIRPKYFILENVASMPKESKETITKELFGIEPVLINSSLLTAQQRKRLYWVGKLVGDKYEQVQIDQPEDKGIYLKDILEKGFVDRDKSYCIDANYHKGGNLKSYCDKGRRQLIFDKPIRIDPFNKGGQADRVYSIKGKSVCLSALGGGEGAKTGLYKIDLPNGDYTIRKLTVNECCKLQGFPKGYCDNISKTQGYKCLGNSFTVPVIKHILTKILSKN